MQDENRAADLEEEGHVRLLFILFFFFSGTLETHRPGALVIHLGNKPPQNVVSENTTTLILLTDLQIGEVSVGTAWGDPEASIGSDTACLLGPLLLRLLLGQWGFSQDSSWDPGIRALRESGRSVTFSNPDSKPHTVLSITKASPYV